MSCLASARLVFFNSLAAPVSLSLCRPRSSLRSLYSSFSTSTTTTTRWPLRRSFSIMADSGSDLFNYTSGRWIFNEALRNEECRRIFNLNGLSRLAAESVDRSPDDIVSFEKLAEGELNRTFLITMRDNFKLVARIPYPVMVPKSYVVASEVATMDFLRSSGLPIPNIYGYSPTSDNVAETEYIFMEFVNGTKLSDIWSDLGEREIESVVHQLVQLEAKMMLMSFPAAGSLYYAQDLERDESFCIGPDVRLTLWYGRRSLLDVDRGPYKSVESVLVGTANKELAYLQQFGQPLLPFRRQRRESYQYKEQSPSDHIDNLQRYLRIASSLVPKDPSLSDFRIRHPDLEEANIMVSRLSDSDLQVVSLLDWHHASILPAFLLPTMPQRLQNYEVDVSQPMTRPSLPEDFDDLDADQRYAKERHHRRLVHYRYVKSTEECNEVHRAALADPMGVLRCRLFEHAGEPWEGETIALKVDLIEATKSWETLTEGGAPCPVVFDDEDVRETVELDAAMRTMDLGLRCGQSMIGSGPEGWVPKGHYKRAMALSKKLKKEILALTESAEERAEVGAHWPFDDMDEEKYT
ncbi:protein kinase subdomain-containing protein PKL/CAK/Fmp29 [Russula dissimulans]|nr:protein kinase subdomain-containing protein PKL/CAK/Fmp29 [Russula dissimulans]